MSDATTNSAGSSLAALRRFAALRAGGEQERCDLCAAPLGPSHDHLVEPATRRLLCACQACAILFGYRAATKYRRVPRDAYAAAGLRLDDAAWNALGIPIGLAFFV